MTPHVNHKVLSSNTFGFGGVNVQDGWPSQHSVLSVAKHQVSVFHSPSDTSSMVSIDQSELSHSLGLKDMFSSPRSPFLSTKYFPWKMIEDY